MGNKACWKMSLSIPLKCVKAEWNRGGEGSGRGVSEVKWDVMCTSECKKWKREKYHFMEVWEKGDTYVVIFLCLIVCHKGLLLAQFLQHTVNAFFFFFLFHKAANLRSFSRVCLCLSINQPQLLSWHFSFSFILAGTRKPEATGRCLTAQVQNNRWH